MTEPVLCNFNSHVTTQKHCQYTTLVDIKKLAIKRRQSLNHMRHEHCESGQEQRIALVSWCSEPSQPHRVMSGLE